MPITKVLVKSKYSMGNLLTWSKEPLNNVILIRNPDASFEDTSKVERVCGVKFWDTSPEWAENYIINQQGHDPTIYPLPPEDALEKIYDFIQDLEDIERNETLYVSCHAGISRSGAVGLFANKYFGLDYSDFKHNNPQVQPNPFIERELERIHRERIEMEKQI